jgi:DNA-binding NarL/FixJ family response regulator
VRTGIKVREARVPLQVLLCDDRPLVLDGLGSLLGHEDDIEVVATTSSGLQALMLVREHRPDVVVTALHLRQVSGLDFIRKLQTEPLDPLPRVIVFAVDEIGDEVAEAVHAGVSGLLADDASPEELALSIRAVARGHAMLGPRIAQQMMEWFREHAVPPRARADLPAGTVLTPREKEILALTARGLSAEDIAAELFIGPATVRTHLYRLRTKLHVRDRAQLVSLAFRAGFVDPV